MGRRKSRAELIPLSAEDQAKSQLAKGKQARADACTKAISDALAKYQCVLEGESIHSSLSPQVRFTFYPRALD